MTANLTDFVLDDTAIVAVSGELDLASSPFLTARCATALATAQVLVLGLGGVTFIDCTGLGALVRLRNDCLEQGKRLRLRDVPSRVQRLLSLTGLESVFRVEAPAEVSGDDTAVIGQP